MYPVEVNYVAALVSAVVVFLLGALWYGPLFGKAWMAAQGLTEEQLREASQGMAKTYGMTFVSYLIMALVLAILIYLVNPPNVAKGLWLGSMVWFGFMLPVNLTDVLFSQRKLSLAWVNGGYQLISALLMAGILTGWR